MAKKNMPEVKNEQKVQTKYDRKIEERKRQKIKDARQAKMTKLAFSLIGIVLIAAIVISTAVSIVRKNGALKETYVKIGDYELTQLEYDYFYEVTVSNYLNSMASILPYMGVDPSGDFAQQQYSENMTWKDLFDEMTVEQIRQSKALLDDARKAGFTYDTTADYESFTAEFESAAQSAGMNLSDYYKASFGTYATAKNVEPFIKEGMVVSAYYSELLESNAPSKEEIRAYYEENKRNYDKADYRSFTFTADTEADATEEEMNAAMDEIRTKAESMMKARQDGEDFEALCIENASDEEKANYEDEETQYSLSEGRYSSGIPSVISDWLYEDGRKEGDIAVLEDEVNHQYYVAEFVNRYYDETDDANISNTLSNTSVTEYIASLLDNYPVTDVKGNLKYLTVSQHETDTTKSGNEEVNTDETEASGDTE